MRVKIQLDKYNKNYISDNNNGNENNDNIFYLEGCKSMQINKSELSNCSSCQDGYELVHIKEQNRNLCKLKYKIDQDLYIKDINGVYQEKNIFAIKMLYSPIENKNILPKKWKNNFLF